MQKILDNIFWILEIMAFQAFEGTYVYHEDDSCDRQLTCDKRVLRLQIWLKENFSNSICLGLIESYDQRSTLQILRVLGTREDLDSRRMLWKRSFLRLK